MRDRSADDKRRTGIIDQHGIDLVDDGVVMFRTLHHVLRVTRHVVTQVVEAELVVGTVGDVGVVCGAAFCRVRLVLVDAVDSQTEEVVQRSHPLRVTLCQVIVDGHHMHATAREASQIHRQGSHEGLTFTCRHLSYLTLMQHYTANDLHVVMHHIPTNHIAAGHPARVVEHAVTLDSDVLALRGKVTVEVGGSSFHHFAVLEASCHLFQHCESLRHDVVQSLVDLLEDFLLQLVNLLVDVVFLLQIHVRIGFDARLQLGNLSFVLSDIILDIFPELHSLMTQAVNVQILDFLIRVKRFL